MSDPTPPRKRPEDLRSHRWYGAHGSARVRPSLAHRADGLRPLRLRRQAGHRDPQHLERHQPVPRAFQAARRGRQARRLAGRRVSGRAAGDDAVRAVPEADDDALPQLPRDGDRGAAALVSGRRRRADGRLRQDDAGADHGRDVDEPAGDLHAGRSDAARRLARRARSAPAPTSGSTGPSCAPAPSPRATGARSSRASRARPATA